MPGTQITGSTNIAVLDSKIVANTCIGKFYVDISPSIWIGSGKTNVLGANIQITNPLGVIVKPYGSNYEIAPALSAGMDAVISFNIPTQGGTYQFGTYTVEVKLFDANGTSYLVTKSVKICEPDQKNITRNYATLSAKLSGVCKDGKLFVIVNNLPVYNGKNVESQVNDFTLDYPTASGLTPLTATVTSFSVQLFEGVYKFEGTVCGLYNMGDNIYVKILFKVNVEKNQKCLIDECCVQAQFAALIKQMGEDCTDAEKANTANIILESLLYIKEAELAANCGEDPSPSIEALEKLLGCSCTCACNEGTPIIDQTPGRDVVITGCGVYKSSTGLTDTYTIDNYEYKVTVVDNGGAITIAAADTNGCIKTQVVTFNVDVVYSQIKEIANSNNTEALFWASVIRKSLVGLDASCLGLTASQYAQLTLPQIFQTIYSKFCLCCGCTAQLSNVTVTQSGSNLVFNWAEANVYSVDIYVNNIFQTNVLAGVLTYTYIAPRFSDPVMQYRLVPKCANGSSGTPVENGINFTGRVFILPPVVVTNHLVGPCPYDLTTNLIALPLGVTAEWHTANNTTPDTLLPNPTQALQGAYFVFAKDDNNFYSEGVQVTLVCDETGSCSAPQNLSVLPAFGGNLVQFQSAAYPPPLNSYTVKRRLKSDSDIPGNYTTIGTPAWNNTANRWMINDPSAVSNVLYVYRAFSNCGGTAPYIDFEYASIVCPTLTVTPKVTYLNYSFVNSGSEIDKYEVSIYESDGVTLVHKNTHLPVFSNPIIGAFAYLDANTDYRIGIKAYIGTYVKDCGQINASTLSDTATLTFDYIAGRSSMALSNPIADSLIVLAGTLVTGSQVVGCGTPFETDTIPEMQLNEGEVFVDQETGGLSYMSTYYKIDNQVNISGHGIKVNGDTFSLHGVTITVQINRTVCGYYPA